MNTVVIYSSKTGFARQYAEWIAEELQCDIFEIRKFKTKDLLKYDLIIYGGSIQLIKINNIGFIKRNMIKLKDKKLIVFAVGFGDDTPKYERIIFDKNFKNYNKNKIKLFYFKGGLRYKNLNIIDKCLLQVMRISIKLKNKNNVSKNEKDILEAFNKYEISFLNKYKTIPLIEYVKNINNI